MRQFVIAVFGLLVAATVGPSSHAQDGPRVVTSIMPVHSLVSSVMEGVGTPDLLVPGGASPHSFALRPSDARKLQQAQLVFWVGPSLETFLSRPLDALPKNAEVIALEDADGVIKLPFREGGPWEEHDDHGHGDKHADKHDHGHKHGHGHDHGDKHAHADKHDHGHKHGHGHDHGDKHGHADKHDHGDKHGHGHGHAHGEIDVHFWLDPRNAIVFANEIARELAHVDPENKARYEANAAKLVAELQALDKELEKDLAATKGKPYIVFHDAYQYFESRYGLTPAGSITVSPERSPGAKRLVEIRKRIRDDGAVCVFSEPQFEPKLVGTVVQGTDARTGTLDPLGQGIEPGPAAYQQLMRNLVRDLNACIAASS